MILIDYKYSKIKETPEQFKIPDWIATLVSLARDDEATVIARFANDNEQIVAIQKKCGK